MAERTTKRATSGRASSKVTAKKAASKSVAKKSAKKTQVKKVSVKKTVKKSVAKKVVKKVAAKKVVKKATKKPATKKVTNKTTKKTVAKSTATSSTKKRVGGNGDVALSTSHSIGKTDAGVTIFSRVRTDNAVLLVARFFGLAFIITGALFSLIGLNRATDVGFTASVISGVEHQMAQLVSADPDMQNSCYPDLCEPVLYDGEVVQPSISYKLPSNPQSGQETIVVNTEADSVRLRLYSIDDDTDVPLGLAESADKRTWKYTWDTTKVLDGKYQIKAIVTVGTKTFYDMSPSSVFVVENNPHVEIAESQTQVDPAGEGSVASSSEDVVSNDTPTIKFADLNYSLKTNLADPISGTKKIAVRLTDVVVLKARLLTYDRTFIKLLPAVQLDVDDWVYSVDTAVLEPGLQYRTVLEVKTTSGEVLTGGHELFSVATVAQVSAESASGESTEPSTTDENVVSNENTESESELAASVDPRSRIKIDSASNLSGSAVVLVETGVVQFTEMYVRRAGSLRHDFLGLAKPNGTGWRFVWDTLGTPNGEYYLIAKHRNEYGDFYSEQQKVVVNNETVATAAETTYVESVKSSTQEALSETEFDPYILNTVVDETLVKTREPIAGSDTSTDTTLSETLRNSEEEITPRLRELIIEEQVRTPAEIEVERVLTAVNEEMRTKTRAYSIAIREGDSATAQRVLEEIQALKSEAIKNVGENPELAQINKQIEERVDRVVRDVEKAEEVIKRRVGEAILKDSDNDGITDFDEISLYNTNPFSADSDNDGFTDEAEILGGYNPNDAAQEASIKFESPKDTEVIREDVFVVDSIVADQAVEANEREAKVAPAIISGRGLPNSFVTIYIFSTPVVVTVRTNDDGSWSYRFDKELEDGEHEVYVGVTDNAGKIVARSNPLTFVKEAEAFTAVDAEAASATTVSSDNTSPTLLDQNGLVIALAAVITSLGFVLLLVSFFVGRREEEVVHESKIKTSSYVA